MQHTYTSILSELKAAAAPHHIPPLQRFFKTGKGEYGEGDLFMGVKVPASRAVAKKYFEVCDEACLQALLTSAYHEQRFTALVMLTHQYAKSTSDSSRTSIFNFYIKHIPHINNWDLVDCSTHKIVGPYVHQSQNWKILTDLSMSGNLWSQRIAVVALLYLWKKGYYTAGLELIRTNLTHKHDLMHKANGWMLRELGKKGPSEEEMMIEFLFTHYECIPRTTLRYAIEKIKEPLRSGILNAGTRHHKKE